MNMDDKDKKIYTLNIEVRRLREKVDELEQIAEKDRKVISMLLQISDHLFDYIDETAKHVIQLEMKEKEK